jgi:hypothetical protein
MSNIAKAAKALKYFHLDRLDSPDCWFFVCAECIVFCLMKRPTVYVFKTRISMKTAVDANHNRYSQLINSTALLLDSLVI